MTLTPASLLSLLVALGLLAALPSVSVLAVSARAASHGFWRGVATAAGIVAGDLVFILLAVFGLVLLVEAMGPAFWLIQWAAPGYLFWLAWSLWRQVRTEAIDEGSAVPSGGWSAFFSGLLITLGDQKAILFYLGFLPAFMDLSALTWLDVGAIAVITLVSVGGVKVAYAWSANRAARWAGGRAGQWLNRLAALMLGASGLWLLLS